LIDFTGNQIVSLPENIDEAESLVEITVTGNKLTGIPDSLANLENLENLNLSQNAIAKVPDGVALCLTTVKPTSSVEKSEPFSK